MGSKKKGNSIADQINSILKPKELHEERDENEARLENFDEQIEVNNQLSDIRKQTARHLGELDSKYKGKVVSRKELGLEADSESSENDHDLLSEDGSEESELGEEGEEEEEQSDDDEESGSGDESDDSEEDLDDFDISQFSSQKDPASSNADDKTVLVTKSSANEEVKRGVCVQNQLKVWEKLLEARIKAQKMLITANSLPDYDSFIELSEVEDSPFAEKIEDACDGLYNMLDNFLELQSILVER
jgi:protein AATF/BFR2